MEKVSQYKFAGEFYKHYSMEDGYEVNSFIEDVKEAGLEGLLANIYEDVDGEMKSIEGSYDIDDLINNYSDIMGRALYPDDVKISFYGVPPQEMERVLISVNPSTRIVSLITPDESLEVGDFVKKNEHGKKL